jgi:hypothetical protein
MKNTCILLVLSLVVFSAKAQQKPTAKPVATTLPKLTISMGGIKSGNLTIDQLKKIVDSPLVAKDEKGITYPIKSFRINYTFKSSFKDEETQQTRTVKDFRAFDFNNTDRLSEDWRNSIKDNVKKDDQMLINNIVVRLNNGKSFFAPELKLKILQ